MKKLNNTKKRELRNRKKLKSVSNRYRISVFKSLKNISAQIIDDKDKKTLVSVSSIEKEIKANKKKKSETSVLLGEILAKRAVAK
jgi:large subunit ribosomal protein L18